MVTMKGKKTQGRQRIEIKKLENGSNKQVTFSKRRSGLFKKAGELSILCGADVAALVFSPNGKPFCFGHPSFDSVVLRYVRGTSLAAAVANSTTTSTNNNSSTNVDSPTPGSVGPVGEFSRDYVEAAKELEAEKSRLLEAAKKAKSGGGGEKFWWDQGIQGMGIKELEQHMAALHELKRRVAARFQELKMVSNNDASPAVVVLPLAFHRSGLGFEIENNHF